MDTGLAAYRPGCAERLAFPAEFFENVEAMPPISADNQLYFISSVTNKRLPVFGTDALKRICANAFDEARRSSGIRIFAYAIMPDHYHVITDSSRKPAEVLRYLNGISARRVINHLKENGYSSSLDKIRRESSSRESSNNNKEHSYSLWQHHSNTFLITSEAALLQKAHYIHQNPVNDHLAETAADYLYSSFRYWAGKPLNEEPLFVDIKELSWRRS